MNFSRVQGEKPQQLSLEDEAFFREMVGKYTIFLRGGLENLDQRVAAQTYVTLGKTALACVDRAGSLRELHTELSLEDWQDSFKIAMRAGFFHMNYSPLEESLRYWGCLEVKWPVYRTTFWMLRARQFYDAEKYEQAADMSFRVLNDDGVQDDVRTIVRYLQAASWCKLGAAKKDRELLEDASAELLKLKDIVFLQDGLRVDIETSLTTCYFALKKEAQAIEVYNAMLESSAATRLCKLTFGCLMSYKAGRNDLFLELAYLLLKDFVIEPGFLLWGQCSLSNSWFGRTAVSCPEIEWVGNHEQKLVGLASKVADVEWRRGREELAIGVWETLVKHPDASDAIVARAREEMVRWSERDHGPWLAFAIDSEECNHRFEQLDEE